MRAEEIIAIVAFYNEKFLLQRNSTKCIAYEINNSRPICTIHTLYCHKGIGSALLIKCLTTLLISMSINLNV